MVKNPTQRSARNAQRLAEDLRLAAITEEVCDHLSAAAALSELLCGSSDLDMLVDEIAATMIDAHDLDATTKDLADAVADKLIRNVLEGPK